MRLGGGGGVGTLVDFAGPAADAARGVNTTPTTLPPFPAGSLQPFGVLGPGTLMFELGFPRSLPPLELAFAPGVPEADPAFRVFDAAVRVLCFWRSVFFLLTWAGLPFLTG